MSKKRRTRSERTSLPAGLGHDSAPVEPQVLSADADSASNEAGASSDRRIWYALAAGLAILVAAVFANSLGNGFVFDDFDLVVREGRIRSLTGVSAFIGDSYRPIRTISYAIDFAIWGLNPTGFRLTNILIHAVNAIMVLWVARRLTDGAKIASMAAAVFFAVHPVQSESVAYISGRRDVLFSLFFLAGFLAYVRFREAPTRAVAARWLIATGACFALSLMSKEMAASFPLVCVLWDLTRATAPSVDGQRPTVGSALGRMVRQGAILYGAGFIALAGFAYYSVIVRNATTRIGEAGVTFWGGSLLTNTLTVPLTYAHYAKLAVWPKQLAAQYFGAFEPATGFSDPRVVPALIFLAGIAAVGTWLLLRTSHRVAGFGLLWFVVTLLPASQILPHHEIVADHYLYLPLVGVGLVLADLVQTIGWRMLPSGGGTASVTLLVILLGAFAVRTVVRNADWKDDPTLWEATYAAVPESPRAAYNYGLVLTNRGEHERAIPYYQQAIERDPTFITSYFNLASTYAGLGRFDEARDVYAAALSSDIDAAARQWHMTPDTLRALYATEVAMLDATAGRTESARDDLAAILAKSPNMLRTQDFYANVLQMRSETASTIESLRTRLAAAPDDNASRLVLGNLLWKTGRVEDARTVFTEAVGREPTSAVANFALGRYARDVRPGSAAAAESYFEQAHRSALSTFDRETIQRARSGGAQSG